MNSYMNSFIRSRGAAILIMLTIVVLAVTTMLVSQISLNQRKNLRTKDNAAALNAAAEALQGYALAHPVPGTMPCPDTTGDGLENPSAGSCQSQRGLLPLRTLGMNQLTDSSGASLWYAVELSYVANAAGARNSSTVTSLQLDGEWMAAVIIAPGKVLDNQQRTLLSATGFLEGINADANLDRYVRGVDGSNNDQILGIAKGAYWSLVEKQVLSEVGALLANYQLNCGEYPWAASFGGPYDSAVSLQIGSLPLGTSLPYNWGAVCPSGTAPVPAGWLSTHWQDQLYYRMCTTAEGSCINMVGSQTGAATAVVIAPGEILAGQVRPDTDPADYFEDENISAPDSQFRGMNAIDHTGTYNDVSEVLI